MHMQPTDNGVNQVHTYLHQYDLLHQSSTSEELSSILRNSGSLGNALDA